MTSSGAVFQYLDSTQSLRSAMNALSVEPSSWLAVDAERASGFRYRQRAYLIQLKFERGETWLIDPLLFDSEPEGKRTLEEFRSYLPRRWILHSATQDFPCLFELELRPSEVFDTELAAKLLGLPRLGLAGLLHDLHDVELEKEHSASDWSIRPLTSSMLKYAALDVEHLHQLRDTLVRMLREAGRDTWGAQEFDHLLTFRPKTPSESRWRKLPGIARIRDTHTLQIAKALWQTREEIAASIDLSPGRLLPDKSIMVAALMKPESKAALAANSQFSGRHSRSQLDAWWAAVANAGSIVLDAPSKADGVPNHRSWQRKFPEIYDRYQVAKTRMSEISNDLAIAPEILLPPDALREICFHFPQSWDDVEAILKHHSARPWQRIQVEPVLRELLGL